MYTGPYAVPARTHIQCADRRASKVANASLARGQTIRLPAQQRISFFTLQTHVGGPITPRAWIKTWSLEKSSHTQHQYQPAPNSSWLSSLEERNSLLLAVGQRKSLILKMLQLLQRCALGKHHSTLLQRLHPSQPTACISLHMPPGSCRDTHSRR